MPSHVTNASYIEPDFNTDFNVDPHSPVVVFGDHVNIEATAGSRSSGNSLPNVDKIVVASTNGWGGSGAIAPGTWVTISFGVSNDPQSASISFGTVGNPNSVRPTDTFSGNGVRTYVVQMPATDLLITVSGVGGDVFRFLRAAEGGDLIGDFNATIGADKIGIVRSGFGIAATVAVGASFDAHYLVFGLTATEAHGQFLFDGASSALLWDADGTGATSRAVVIAVLPGVTSLNASDFKLL